MSYDNFTNRIARLFSGIVNEKIHDRLDEQIFNIYKLLKQKKCTAKKKFVFNDLDNNAWIDTVYGGKEAVFLSDQNCQFLIILYEVSDNRHKFVAYRYYHDYTESNDLNEKITTAEAVEYATVYMEYSDNINDRDCVTRPDVKYFKNTDLAEEYQLFEPILTIDRLIVDENEEGNEIVKELLKSGLKPDNQNGIGDLPAFSSLLSDIEFTEEELERRTRKKR